jgi:flagellar hook-associated protein 2
MDSINRIRFSGIASGLDTENIVKNLMNIEQMKVDRQIQRKPSWNGSGTNTATLIID